MRPLILIKLFLIKIELFCFIFRRSIIIPISFIIFTLDFSSEDFPVAEARKLCLPCRSACFTSEVRKLPRLSKIYDRRKE